MKDKVLITGITGSGGSYLGEYISANTDSILFGTTRSHNDINHKNLMRIKDKIQLVVFDLTDFIALFRFLDKERPDKIFNIASIANVRQSFDNPVHTVNNNVNITLNLLEAVRLLKDKDGYNPIILCCSTSECYGNPSREFVPIRETCPLRPINPYAVSKLAQDSLSDVYCLNYDLKVVRTRMFSYLNAKRINLFASNFAKQIIDVQRGRKECVEHGNLDSIRSLICADEAAESYWVASCKGKIGEVYNIGGTEQISVGEVLQRLIALAGVPITTRCSNALMRPSDVDIQVPCTEKFTADTGWKPRRSLDESIAHFWHEMNEFWG